MELASTQSIFWDFDGVIVDSMDVKNMAFEMTGKLPKGVKMLSEMMINQGRTAEITDIQEDERDDLELPPAPDINKEKIKKIMEKVGINNKIKGGKEE